MSKQIPAGWYPDPKGTTSDPPPQRWWDGIGWTTDTRQAPQDGDEGDVRVLQGAVVGEGPTVRYPELPPYGPEFAAKPGRRGPSPIALAATVAGLAGLLVGSSVTYLAMDGRSAGPAAYGAVKRYQTGGGSGLGGSGSGGSQGSGGASGQSAIDLVNYLSLAVPPGWTGGNTAGGFAELSVGQYACPGSSADSCTLGGVVTGQLTGKDPKVAAETDIAAAAKESYGDLKAHDELKSGSVTVDGRSGYLVRWRVQPARGGNAGYVETVVFPAADGASLVSVHLGFDIADKAPQLSQMDTIVSSITGITGITGINGTGSNGGNDSNDSNDGNDGI